MTDPLIASLTRAVEAAPDDVRLRTHLAELLIGIGRGAEAVTHCAIALQHAPTDDAARALMARALSPQARQTPAEQAASMLEEPVTDVSTSAAGAPQKEEAPSEAVATPPAPESPEAPEFNSSTTSDGTGNFDWRRAEEDLGGPAAPFVSSRPSEPSGSDSPLSEPRLVGTDGDPADWEVERAGVRLADVGGMTEVKNRLEASFLAPLRNPELRRLYGKSLRGGLLLYGPPGTGKTFIARAIAGEMGAGFLSVTISDILDPYIGNSEANLHNVFQQARDHAPCVLFLDELDAMGMKRSLSRNSSMRSTVNQLLEELDGVGSNNEGVYLDRTLLVLPPDEPARAAILHTHLRERPVEGIDLQALARVTDGLTGADLSHVCDSAAEKAQMDSVRTGRPRLMNMQDMDAALKEVRPSTGPWFETARAVVEYSDASGEYEDLRKWMKRHRLL